MRGSGGLNESVAFDAPTSVPDGSGGFSDGWAEQYTCRAEFIYQRGSEAIAASRLQGRSVYKLRIRQGASARTIVADWRMRDVRRSITYNVRDVDAISNRAFVYLTVEGGVAV